MQAVVVGTERVDEGLPDERAIHAMALDFKQPLDVDEVLRAIEAKSRGGRIGCRDLGVKLIATNSSVTKVQMDTTVRNLDEQAYRELKARAALEGRPIGETLSEAIRVYLRTAPALLRDRSLAELRPEPYAAGTERLSEEIDAVVYGAS